MKIGRNQACPCGSGKKYKHCHLNRQAQEPITEGQVRGMASRHSVPVKCLHPRATEGDCQGKVIRSHTVPKSSTLRKVARDGHVYHFKPDINKLFENGGKPSCVAAGINQASTFPGFCSKHDKEMFAPVEDAPFQSNERHAFLIGYRALTKEIHAKRSAHALIPKMRELDRGRDPMGQAALQWKLTVYQYGVELGLADQEHYKQRYDNAFKADDYSSSRYLVLRFSNIPNIVFSGAIYTEYDFAGNLLQNLADEKKTLEIMAVNAIATEQGGAIVFHWLGDSAVNTQFAQSLIDLPDSQKGSAITQFAFEMFENLFINPDWWDGLSSSEKNALEGRVLCGVKTNHSPECFIPDGRHYFEWVNCVVEHNLGI